VPATVATGMSPSGTGLGGGAFVGRERELAELTAALDGLERGRGSLFLLSGEPGIGKTRLADELAGHAAVRGVPVAWGAAWDGGGAPLLWPWIQVLRAVAPALPTLGEQLRRDLGPLGEAESVGETGSGGDDLEAQRFRRFDALRTLLSEAAARKPR
jgi:AAA ATPase domain